MKGGKQRGRGRKERGEGEWKKGNDDRRGNRMRGKERGMKARTAKE